ncbi:MAG: hypothetical protein WA485_26925 [Candidatus Sulfotelmatobacter sp.]
MVNGKVAARPTNEFVYEIWVNELETVPKGVPLANHRMNRHGAAWKREVQLHDLAQLGFNRQHGSDPGFANVHGTTLQPPASARRDCDIDLKCEPGMAAGVFNCPGGGASRLAVSFSFRLASHINPTLSLAIRKNRRSSTNRTGSKDFSFALHPSDQTWRYLRP